MEPYPKVFIPMVPNSTRSHNLGVAGTDAFNYLDSIRNQFFTNHSPILLS